MLLRSISRLLAALLLAWGFGCTEPPGPPFQVATNIWPGYEPLYLAQQMETLDPRAFRLVEMSSSTDSMRALRTGMVSAAALTLDEALTLVQAGVDLRIVLVMDASRGADALLGQPGLGSLADLRGRRVGVENNAVGAYLLTRALEAAGLELKDITAVPLTEGDHEQAFLDRSIDALVTFEPVRSRLLASGARVLFDSGRIPDEIFDVLVVRAETARLHPDRIEQLRAAWFFSLDYLRTHPREAIARMAPREGLTEAAFRRSLEGLAFPDRDAEARLRRGGLQGPARRLADIMVRTHLLAHPVDPSSLFRP
ncbi:MAG TPA: ABC transporter substrate-binding protein [Holophaga sp.]|nr:ABC transporter substrate-binding protein [Holophaga sp.]